MNQTLVKCPHCDYYFKTQSIEYAQCSASNGCGKRFQVKGNMINWQNQIAISIQEKHNAQEDILIVLKTHT